MGMPAELVGGSLFAYVQNHRCVNLALSFLIIVSGVSQLETFDEYMARKLS